MALKFAKLASLIIVAILFTYFGPKELSSVFYIGVVIVYLYSKDESLWLTFFFVLSDGFLGFFNNYEAVISIIPGLPDVEVGHLYVLGSLFKLSSRKERRPRSFHEKFLVAMLLYVLFLVVQGYALGAGSELKHHFRILKFILPLALFYTIPRLLDGPDKYRETFHLFLPFAFLALFAQVFTVATGLAPSQALGLTQKLLFTDVLKRGHTYRGFYSTGMVLISFFGALYYATVDPSSKMRPLYMAAILANILSAFLSATRGWILCFAVVLLLHALFIARFKAQQVVLATVVAVVMLFGILQIPAVAKQFQGASDRILTVGLIAKGDVTAGGTLERLDRRAPRVMKKWSGSPLTGWGFSEAFHEYSDSHVGNHNVLLHAGIIGALLMASFLLWYAASMVVRSRALPARSAGAQGLLVFPVFLVGWFIIHSSSGQQFQFYGEPGMTIPQALFFGFGALCHRRSYLGEA